MDVKSVGLYCISLSVGFIGFATLNIIAIVLGALAALTTVVYNAIKIYKEINKR